MKSKQPALILLLTSLFVNLAFASDLVVALKPDKNPDKMISEKKNLEIYLSGELKRKVTVLIPLSGATIQQGLANGTIDLAYLSSLDLYQAQSKKTAELLLVGQKKGKTSYESVWLVLKDDPRKSIAEFKNKPIAFASLTSTSGFLVPSAQLYKAGLIQKSQTYLDFFGKKNVFFGTGYTSAVQKLLDGQAEAAAVSDYVFDEDKHLTKEEKSKLRVLQRQGPVPTHILAVRRSLDLESKKSLKVALLKMNQEQKNLRDQVFTSELVETDPVKHMKEFSEFVELTQFLK